MLNPLYEVVIEDLRTSIQTTYSIRESSPQNAVIGVASPFIIKVLGKKVGDDYVWWLQNTCSFDEVTDKLACYYRLHVVSVSPTKSLE